jgi:hypothetical protein
MDETLALQGVTQTIFEAKRPNLWCTTTLKAVS